MWDIDHHHASGVWMPYRLKRKTSWHYLNMSIALAVASAAFTAGINEARADDGLDQSVVTSRVESAIDRGLTYLSKTQATNGQWKTDYPGAIISLAMLAFMSQGHFPDDGGPYESEMSKALDALLEISESNEAGVMGTSMYGHGLAVLALSELWGETDRDEDVRLALNRGVDVILRAQSRVGGWRYRPRPDNQDVSVTAMQVVALASARQAGISVPDKVIDKAIRYINMCHDKRTGGFCYTAGGEPPQFGRTAAGTAALMLCGRHNAPEVTSGVNYLNNMTEEDLNKGAHFEYSHYYGVIVMRQASDTQFDRWYTRVRDKILQRQQADGSWSSNVNEAAYATAMGVITLSSAYQFIPAYQR